ncbi:FAD-binding oxidoreductase, partial [Klebsiella pneumoniae]|nr:FAD-binding oxidoreductase [Klebsiella pneumoniae]
GALHWHNPKAVNSPGDLTKSYARLFIREGGSLLLGDAKSLQQVDGGWTVRTMNGDISASSAVLALGPWSDEVFRPLGYRIPLTVKRGYHR